MRGFKKAIPVFAIFVAIFKISKKHFGEMQATFLVKKEFLSLKAW